MFQFQTGSIKSLLFIFCGGSDAGKFQFQTGSIKRNFLPPLTIGVYEFQFQTGSIKRRPKNATSKQSSFNSKLVRLKAEKIGMSLCYLSESFNSKLVRLKAFEGCQVCIR